MTQSSAAQQLLQRTNQLRLAYVGEMNDQPFEADLWLTVRAWAQGVSLGRGIDLPTHELDELKALVEEARGFWSYDSFIGRYVFHEFYALMEASKRWQVKRNYSAGGPPEVAGAAEEAARVPAPSPDRTSTAQHVIRHA